MHTNTHTHTHAYLNMEIPQRDLHDAILVLGLTDARIYSYPGLSGHPKGRLEIRATSLLASRRLCGEMFEERSRKIVWMHDDFDIVERYRANGYLPRSSVFTRGVIRARSGDYPHVK